MSLSAGAPMLSGRPQQSPSSSSLDMPNRTTRLWAVDPSIGDTGRVTPVPVYARRVASETYSRHLIRMARRHAGLTQQDLADRAGTSQAAISAYEAGRRSPSVDTLCRVLGAAGFELRMRLAEPDTHEQARQLAEQLLPADQLAAHNHREHQRMSRSRAST